MKIIDAIGTWSLLIIVSLFTWNCGDDGVIFSIEDDKMLGMRTDSIIEQDPSFDILSEREYPEAYAYLNQMKEDILNSGQVKYRDEFVWELHIIDNDSTLNAFATPGGYLYFYTGLIHYLDDATSLAGVLGHEIAHSDQRHSSRQLQKQMGVQTILNILLGENLQELQGLAANLLALKFSRNDETDADNHSVEYLCETDFEADGAANFFQKLIDNMASPGIPEFLSTHPNPDNRVENIRSMAASRSCGTELSDPMINGMSYQEFQNLLP